MGDMERYWDVTEGFKNIIGNNEGDNWAMTGFDGLIMRRTDMWWASLRGPWPSWGTRCGS
jgi:hypothetical protein